MIEKIIIMVLLCGACFIAGQASVLIPEPVVLAMTPLEGGVLITSTPCYFYIHDYPSDYFRYTNEGVRVLGKEFVFKEIVCFGHPYFPQQIFGIFSNRKLEMNIQTFVDNYRKAIAPKIRMDLRNFLRYIMVDMTKKVFRG